MTDRIQETRAEWNAFSDEHADAKARTGSALSLTRHDRGFSTIIGRSTETLLFKR